MTDRLTLGGERGIFKERSKQLGYSDRLKIEMLYKMKFGVKEIAVQVNKSKTMQHFPFYV